MKTHLASLRTTLSPKNLRADLIAGVMGATIVIPQGVAFAQIAGMPPAYGFYTSMVPVIIAALAGSSRLSVSGPNTAMCLMIFAALYTHYLPGSPDYITAALVLSLLVGLMQVGLALARMGAVVDFISHSVMVGFVTAAALQILVSQLAPALGLKVERAANMPEAIRAITTALPYAQPATMALTAITIGSAWLCRRIAPKLPAYLIALAVATLVGKILSIFGHDLPGVGAIDGVLPTFGLPAASFSLIRELAPAALAIAIVGLLQSASIARTFAQRSGQGFDSNREFFGQGLSNIFGSLFQSFPASASFTRSGVNFESGARSPLAAVFAALFLVVILYFVAPVFAAVPLAGIAGIIILVSFRLIDRNEIRQILQASRAETAIMLATFLIALLVKLEFSILTGVLMSLAIFLRNTARPHVSIGAPDPETPGRIFRNTDEHGLPECPQLVIARINGPLYFGSVEFIRREFSRIADERPDQKHMLFIVKGVGEIDLSGAELLVEEARIRARRGGSLHLQTRNPRQLEKVARLHVLRKLTRSNIHLSKGTAIAAIIPTLNADICRNCRARVFLECAQLPDASLESGNAGPGQLSQSEGGAI